MNLNTKIPPLIVTLIFASPIYLTAEYFYSVEFLYQSMVSIIFAVVAVCILAIAVLQFKYFKTTVNPLNPKTASTLVTTGIFKFTRNPMYLGMLLLIISLWINTGAVLGFMLVPGYFLYIKHLQILPEEESMKVLFPDKYEAYCQQVRRWL